jgi:hypothetical protein
METQTDNRPQTEPFKDTAEMNRPSLSFEIDRKSFEIALRRGCVEIRAEEVAA